MEKFTAHDLYMAKRILCVQPHYDDNDIGAGGTLALLAKSGVEIIYLTVTDDLVGFLNQSVPNEEASAILKQEQRKAGKLIGVKKHYWLGYPDAGEYNYFDLRRDVIHYIRMLQPNYIFTVDPWLLYEAHFDHIKTGRAVAEASILYHLLRIATIETINNTYKPFNLKGILFYLSNFPNFVLDITQTKELKISAIKSYVSQFTHNDMDSFITKIEIKERNLSKKTEFRYSESFKYVEPEQLHINTDSWFP